MSLNDAQARAIATALSHVSGLLDDVERATRGADSPFARDVPDLSPAERAAIAAFVEETRTELVRALERLAVPPPTARSSARWSVRTALLVSDLTLSELNLKGLARYGVVDADVSRELEAIVAGLRSLIGRGLEVVDGSAPE